MKTTRISVGMLLLAAAVLSIVSAAAQAVPNNGPNILQEPLALQVLLQDPNNAIQCADKIFSNFHNYISNGTIRTINQADGSVIVQPFQFNAGNIVVSCEVLGNVVNIIYQPLGAQFPPPSSPNAKIAVDTLFDFDVMTTGDFLISAVDLAMNASADGGGLVSINEVVNPVAGANKALFVTTGPPPVLSDIEALDEAVNKVSIQKDWLMQNYDVLLDPLTTVFNPVTNQWEWTVAPGRAFISDFRQSFEQTTTVPEPVSVGLSMLGLGALAAFASKRRSV